MKNNRTMWGVVKVERGIAAITVGLARHGEPALTPPLEAQSIAAQRQKLGFVSDSIAQRAEQHAKLTRVEADELARRLRDRVGDLLDEWSKTAAQKTQVSARLEYGHEENAPCLLKDPLDPAFAALPAYERKFRAQHSLRDVEASVPVWVKRLDLSDVPTEDE